MIVSVSACLFFFFFKQKTAYGLRISDWSSDVCSSDLSIWTRSPVRCSPPWNRPTRRKGRRGARGARPSFKDAGARLGDALAATAKAETKLAQARHRVEAAKRRTDTRGWVVQRRERTRHLLELGGLVQQAGRADLNTDARAQTTGDTPHSAP